MAERRSRALVDVLLLGSLLCAGGPAQAAIFVVNDTGDGSDPAIDGTCDATGPAGCTLRAAIQEANGAPGLDTIQFNIAPGGLQTILPGSFLPTITSPVIIDGTTQPGFAGTPIIELNGTLTTGAGGLTLVSGSSGSTIRGLVVNQFENGAIRILPGSSNNVIVGNYLGTDPTGTFAAGNAVGVFVQGTAIDPASNNRIGGTTAAERNVISGNTVDGVQITGVGATGNLVQGNFIGLDVTGTADLGNGATGVAIFGGAKNNIVGGTAAGAGNVISGNDLHGVGIANTGTTGNRVEGNFIGTDAAGTGAIGNGAQGVEILDFATGNTIGGTVAGARNVISGNAGTGVFLAADSNQILGNYIGVAADGITALPNNFGVVLDAGANDCAIGGSAAGAGNRIAHNTMAGIALLSTAGTGNHILGNEIHSNGGLGIDLENDGVTANDALDLDTGPNELLNFPVITSVIHAAGTLTVSFQLDVPAGSYRVEFFKNPSGADPSGFGEGEILAGVLPVTHPGGGSVTFNQSFAGAVGDVVTATTTACTDGATCSLFGNTSELGNALAAVEGPKVNYRSIGMAPDYGTGTLTALAGSRVVKGSGTSFLSANRGRGDRIRIDGTDYTILSVDSETVLTLTIPFVGATGSGKSYTISRQFGKLETWEACISGTGPCFFFPVASSSLVADNREEIGIVYNDNVFTPPPGGVVIDALTDPGHTITLTADPGNRHNGVAGAGVVVDGLDTPSGIVIRSDRVKVEWLELIRVRGADMAAAITVDGALGSSKARLRNLLIHDYFDTVAGDISGIRFAGVGGETANIRNVMIWDGDRYGIEGGAAGDTANIDNVSIDDIRDGGMGIATGASTFTVRNTIVTRSPGGDFVGLFDAASSNNSAMDGSAPGTSPDVVTNADVFIATGNLHLNATPGNPAVDTALDLSAEFVDDVDGGIRAGGWDRGADERDAPPPFRIHYRSIGTFTGTLASGTASIGAGSTTATFASSLPGNVGQGDRLMVGTEEFFIFSVDSPTQVTVQEAAGSPHTSEAFTITRAYNTLQAWEDGRQGDLVVENRREVGVAYNDGPFTAGVEIDGSKTDAMRFLHLTVAPRDRHWGVAGTGVLVDGQNLVSGQVEVEDDYCVVEWLEVKRVRGAGAVAAVQGRSRSLSFSHLILHDNKEGVRASGSGGNDFTIRNSLLYDNDDDGVSGDELTDTILVENCTIFRNGDSGIDQSKGTLITATNNISVKNADKDFDIPSGTQSNNLSSDATAVGPGSLPLRTVTDDPSPGAGDWVIFQSLVPGSEDLHLAASVENDAVDTGADLSASFSDDIDGTGRVLPWDLGADEVGPSGRGPAISSAGNQSFVVGSAPTAALTLTVLEDAIGGNITTTGDLRIRIPATFNMRWDTSVSTVALGGGAAGRVDPTIKAYEDGGKTVVLAVASDFFPNDDLTVDGLAFMSFTAPSPLDNLELETGNDGFVSATDDKTIVITAAANPTISSDADQAFSDGAPPTLASPITVTDAVSPTIVVGSDISIVIPAGLDMTWDASFFTPTFGGPAATKVDPKVTFVNGDKTLVITVNAPFAVGDYLVVSNVYFANFVGPSSGNLALEIAAVPTDTDDKTKDIFATGAVKVFTATSTNLNNHLAWVAPDDPGYQYTRILARDDGIFPKDPLDLVSARLVADEPGLPGQPDLIDDGGLTNDTTYYYTAFAFDGTQYSAGVPTTGRPFDHLAGDVRWAYSTGATAMAPPALRFETSANTFVYAVSNDSIIHAMNGSGSLFPGEWPANWEPYRLGGLAQQRPMVVPFAVGGATKGAVFLGSQDGTAYAVDAETGGLEWQSAPLGDMLLASPGGIFSIYGAPYDFLVVGTRNTTTPNQFHGLNPFTGNVDWTFDNSLGQSGDGTSIGIVSSVASVQYKDPGDGSRYFFFTSRADTSPNTVWCVKWDGVAVSLVWASDLPGVSGSPNIDGSAIRFNLYGGRIYVGTNAGEVVALDAATGNVEWIFDAADGPIKGFLFPQFGTTNLLFSTTNKIWSLSDDGTGRTVNTGWPVTFVPNPSTPLYVSGSSAILVGSSDGHLYQLDATNPVSFLKEKLGDGNATVGMPTLDVANAVIYVGTEGGIYYSVGYPLLP